MNIYDFIVDIELTEFLSGVSSLATVFAAIIAYRALNAWKKGIVLQKSLDNLDRIIEATISTSRSFSQALNYIRLLQLSIDAYRQDPNEVEEFAKSGVVKYITQNGKDDSASLKDMLTKNEALLNELELQLVLFQRLDDKQLKSMVIPFNNMQVMHKKLVAFASIIGSTSLYWNNPKVEETVLATVNQDMEELYKNLEQSREELLKAVDSKHKTLTT
ncbi:hypothetical protein QTG68_004489 [Vibrio vulnificus]|nr:hypothetical protein [Vibrio vulnificus]ELP5932702.1 hypothetical protein [Vibrio vulnificus]ELQ2457429.1 hypothetical protein [Vibrio vulnificus]ELQ2514760.1 hypothetical protein [Vibrio vulnificus]ELX4144655.1 hypothetical protein [Vibrio vulnificus]